MRTPDPQPTADTRPIFDVAGNLMVKPISFGTADDAEAFQLAALAAIRETAPDILELETSQ